LNTNRLEAFSDGVLAIIITIMVLELKAPHEPSIEALRPLVPALLSYVLSFIYLGIYWNNHHHMLHASERVSGASLWANLHLLFWLSLVPFVTAWNGETSFASAPLAMYGAVLLMASLGWWVLQRTLVAAQGADSMLAHAFGRDLKGNISLVLYLLAIPIAFKQRWLSGSIYVFVALLWLIPDRRIERELQRSQDVRR
jgi:uncharacterized membrane protein